MKENILGTDVLNDDFNVPEMSAGPKEPAPPKESLNIFIMFRELLNLQGDMDEERTVEDIKRNIDFRSGNAWMLVFAIFIASIGLNINSTAVIIGAMLISPLMGPIVGAGLALGTNDFELFKRSLRSLGAAVVISVLTSTLYFLLTPIQDAQSELLARTRPTVFDVLIAVFGGAAGIIAASRQERGNAIPGVAIATALMPPLCTAGYGLAHGFFSYFLGAIYLFIINCVFICFSTFLFVRYLHFSKSQYLDKKKEKKIHQMTAAIALLVFIPSVFLAFTFTKEASFRSKARQYLQKEFNFPNSYLIEKEFTYHFQKPTIKVTLIGDRLEEKEIGLLKSKLDQYGISDAELIVKQSALEDDLENRLKEKLEVSLQNKFKSSADSSELQIQKIQAELARYQQRAKENELKELELAKYHRNFELTLQLQKEINLVFPKIRKIHLTSIQINLNQEEQSLRPEGETPPISQLALVHWKSRPSKKERMTYEKYLKERLDNPDLLFWEVQ